MQKRLGFFGKLNEQKMSYIFVAPAVLLFLIFVLGPMVASFYWSFT